MLPIIPGIPDPIDIFTDAVSSVAGWAWDKVVEGVFSWFAKGLLLLIELVWRLLDTATTPRLTDDWFVNGVAAALAPIALFVVVAMMLMTAIQAALSGRPELIGDAFTSGLRAIAGTAFTLVVLDTLIRFADLIGDTVWTQARPNTRQVLDAMVQGVLGGKGWGATFLGPVALLIGMIGMIVTAVLLFMRSALLYFVAAFAPLMWSTSVLPMMRGGVRKLIHTAVALVLAKPAIVITLAIGMQLIASSPTAGAEANSDVVQVGTLLTGFFAFAVAAFSPWVVYKLLPSAEGAAAHSGIVGGWARSGMTVAQGTMMARSMTASKGAAATKPVPDGTAGSSGAGAASGATGSTGTAAAGTGAAGSVAAGGSAAAGRSAAAGAAAAHPVGAVAGAATNAARAATTAAASTTSTAAGSSAAGGSTARSGQGGGASAGQRPGSGARRVVIPSSRSNTGGGNGDEE